jgi:hypothetical protein
MNFLTTDKDGGVSTMSRLFFAKHGKLLLVLLVSATLLPACGSGRKKYLAQIMPLVEQNDQIDAEVAKLPKVNAFEDPDYLRKLDGYIGSKQAILNRMEAMEPPFLMATVHAKLVQAMKDGIRYLQSEREKFTIAEQKMSQMPAPSPGQGSEEMEIIRQYESQSAAYQANMREQLMKQQYEKLYDDVKDELERAKKF